RAPPRRIAGTTRRRSRRTPPPMARFRGVSVIGPAPNWPGGGGAGKPGAPPTATDAGYPACTPVGALLSSEARSVLFNVGDAAGAAGICKRWPQAGQFFFVPPSLAGDSRGFLQFGQLYLMGGAGLLSSLATIVLARLGCAATGAGRGAAGTCSRWPHA